MILPLRRRHRRMLAVIGVALPCVFILGIAARAPVPLRAAPPLASDLRNSQTEVWNRSDVFSNVPIGVRLLRGPMSSFHTIVFLPGRGFGKPDLLVYWVAGTQNPADSLPDNARLLGPFPASKDYQLPQTEHTEGAVVLYSLADHEIVDWSKPISVNAASKQ